MSPRPLRPNLRISFCPAYFQSLSPRSERGTNCPRLPTLSVPFSFQQLTTIKFCNSFLLIMIRIARGVVYPLRAAALKFHFKSLATRHSPLPIVVNNLQTAQFATRLFPQRYNSTRRGGVPCSRRCFFNIQTFQHANVPNGRVPSIRHRRVRGAGAPSLGHL